MVAAAGAAAAEADGVVAAEEEAAEEAMTALAAVNPAAVAPAETGETREFMGNFDKLQQVLERGLLS